MMVVHAVKSELETTSSPGLISRSRRSKLFPLAWSYTELCFLLTNRPAIHFSDVKAKVIRDRSGISWCSIACFKMKNSANWQRKKYQAKKRQYELDCVRSVSCLR